MPRLPDATCQLARSCIRDVAFGHRVVDAEPGLLEWLGARVSDLRSAADLRSVATRGSFQPRSERGHSSMAELDAEMMVDQVTMLGLVSREQLHEATADAEDGSPDAVLRMLLRKGALTSWQIDRLKKGDPSGFFFGDAKVLFHLAEGTFARVYRGEHMTTKAALAIKVLRQRFALIPEAVDRFHKEAEAGMRLHHPNIVQVIDVGPAGESALHDHGVRRGDEPARFHEAAHADHRPTRPCR